MNCFHKENKDASTPNLKPSKENLETGADNPAVEISEVNMYYSVYVDTFQLIICVMCLFYSRSN